MNDNEDDDAIQEEKDNDERSKGVALAEGRLLKVCISGGHFDKKKGEIFCPRYPDIRLKACPTPPTKA